MRRSESSQFEAKARQGKARQGKARHGMAKHGKARRGKSKLPTRLHRSREGMRPPRRAMRIREGRARTRGAKGEWVMEERRGSKTESG